MEGVARPQSDGADAPPSADATPAGVAQLDPPPAGAAAERPAVASPEAPPVHAAAPDVRASAGTTAESADTAADAAGPPSPPRSLRTWSPRRLTAACLALVAVSTLCAYLASAARAPVYAARADVLFELSGSSQEAERQLATQRVLLSSRGVLEPVARKFDVPLSELTRSQEVEQISGSEILRLQVRHPDRVLAVRLTQAVADGYVAAVSAPEAAGGEEQERQVRDKITQLSVTAAAVRARLEDIAAARAAGNAGPRATEEERQLQVQESTLSPQISALQAQLTELLVARENDRPARILTEAYLLDEPVAPQPVRAAAAGAMAGILLASLLLALALRGRGIFLPG